MDQILSGEDTETVVGQIHDYLGAVAQDVREGRVPLEEFIIFKVRLENMDTPTGINGACLIEAREESRGLPRRQKSASRTSGSAIEGPRSLCSSGRCHFLHLLSW